MVSRCHGGGTLTLTNVSTFTGDTTISAGTLALSGAGSLNSTAGSISIAAGATFDVSGVTTPPYHVRTGKTLSGGGVSGGATINGALSQNGGGFLTLIYVSGTPAINVTGGELTLNGCATTVTVSGSALGLGSYKLISAGAGGSVAGTLPASVTVGGSGLAANTTASLRITSGELWLDVASAVVPRPVITSFELRRRQLDSERHQRHRGEHLLRAGLDECGGAADQLGARVHERVRSERGFSR